MRDVSGVHGLRVCICFLFIKGKKKSDLAIMQAGVFRCADGRMEQGGRV